MAEPQTRIRLLLPYFGPWPRIFPLFLDSCRRNPHLEFLFFTDNPWPDTAPPNVTHVRMSFEEVVALAAHKLHVTMPEGMRPYKLCEFKPAYAVIFEEHLQETDFWGYGDCDLIFGNTSTFVTPERLREFDVVTFRNDWIHGPFTLYRNRSDINRLFEASPEHRRYFETKAYCNFDECVAVHEELEGGADVLTLHPQPICMTGLVRAAARDGRLRLHTDMAIVEKLPDGQSLTYRHGDWFDGHGRRQVLYHLFREKKLPYFTYPDWTELPDEFYVTETGFYTADQFRRRSWLSGARRARGHAEHFLGRVKRRLTRTFSPRRTR